MPTFFGSLRKYLKTVPALAALTEIYGDEAEIEPDYPYLIVDELFEIPHNNATQAYYVESTMQFTVHAESKLEAKTLSRAAYNALEHDVMPILGFDEGYEMYGRERGQYRGPRGQTAGRPEGDKIWQASFDYTFLIGRNRDV